MAETKRSEIPKDLEKTLQRNDSNQKSFSELLHRAETLVSEQLPEKHEHLPVTKKMSEFTRRNSTEPQK